MCRSNNHSFRTARALATNIEILDASVYEISSSNAARGLRACKRFILGYSWLAYSSYCDGRKVYKLRPKFLGRITSISCKIDVCHCIPFSIAVSLTSEAAHLAAHVVSMRGLQTESSIERVLRRRRLRADHVQCGRLVCTQAVSVKAQPEFI